MISLIWGYFTKYWYIGAAMALFGSGWYLSYDHYAVKQLNINLVAAKAVQAQIEHTLDTERQINNGFQQQNLQYVQQLHQQDLITTQQLQDLKNEKDKLNSTNHLNIMLMRSVGATSSNTNVPTNAGTTELNRDATTSVPADEYAQWALGLRDHDQKCTLQVNALIDLYNSEMKKINGN